jgi:hypothetical protein
MRPEDKAFLFRTLRDPVIREALERLAPINHDAQTALRVARALDPLIESRGAEERVVALCEALSQPGVLDDLRASRDEPFARDLLWVAARLGREA